MKLHLPSALLKSLLTVFGSMSALTLSSGLAWGSLRIDEGDTLEITHETSPLTTDLELADKGKLVLRATGNMNNNMITLEGGTVFALDLAGNGAVYNLFTNVSELKDAAGNTLNLSPSNNSVSYYFDTTLPGTGYWADSSLQMTADGILRLVRHNETVTEAITITARITNDASYSYYEGVKVKDIVNTLTSDSYGGAIYGDSITLSNNGSVSFEENTASATTTSNYIHGGGSIYAQRNITLSNNGSVSFSGNSANTTYSYAYGGAIFLRTGNSDISISDNGSVIIEGNSASANPVSVAYAYAYGGAIYGRTIISNNRSVRVNGNTVSSTGEGENIYARGGAIYRGAIISGNGSVSFSGNTANGFAEASGGAIYENVTLSGNGSVGFSENKTISTFSSQGGAIFGFVSISDSDSVSFCENTASSTSSYASGGAINGGVEIYSNGSVLFEGNKTIGSTEASAGGGAISGNVEIYNNGSVNFLGNTASGSGSRGGAINGFTINLSNNGSVCFERNMASGSLAYGGAIYGEGVSTIELSNNSGSVIFRENTVNSTSSYAAYGGAIDGSSVTLSNNGSVCFERNTASSSSNHAGGGAICGSTIELSNNTGGVIFRGNTSSSYSTDNASGGAIYGGYGSIITLSNNGSVSFESNTASASSAAGCGGAIYGYTITLSNNRSVCFKGNTASGSYLSVEGGAIFGSAITLYDNGSVIFEGNTARTGGAIYGNWRSDPITLSDNGSVSFCGNTANSSYSYGGAIYGGSESSITLSNNDSVSFDGNTALGAFEACGGAIYGANITLSNNGSVSFCENTANSSYSYGGAIYSSDNLSILNNKSVLFEKNAEVSNGVYRLRSIYVSNIAGQMGATISLSSVEGGNMEFRDCIYIASGCTVKFNQDYVNAAGEIIKQTGDIIFTGAYTERHLADIKGSAGSVTEILNSRTSIVNTITNLYGGRLRVEDGAVFQGHGIMVVDGAGATVCLKDGTLNHAGYAITINSENILSLQGVNTITAGNLTMVDGSNLNISMKDHKNTAAVLTTTGNIVASSINFNLSDVDALAEGTYQLLSRTEDEAIDISGWALEGVIDRELYWKGGTLHYCGKAGALDITSLDKFAQLGSIEGNLIINCEGIELMLDKVIHASGSMDGDLVINAGRVVISGDGEVPGGIVFNGTWEAERSLRVDKNLNNIHMELNNGAEQVANVEISEGKSMGLSVLRGDGDMRKTGKGEMLLSGKGHNLRGKIVVEEGQLAFGGDSTVEHAAQVNELVVGSQDITKTAKVKVDINASVQGTKLHVDGKNSVVFNKGSMNFSEDVKVIGGRLDNCGSISHITLEGGIVSGCGTFAGLTMSGGTLVVGNSPGVMTYTDALLATGGELVFSVAGTEAATIDTSGWEFDAHSQIDMSNCELSLDDVVITIAFGGDMAMAEEGEYSLTLFSNVGNIVDFDAEALSELAENTSFTISTEAGALIDNITMMPEITSTNYTVQGNNIVLNYSVSGVAVPEPTSATLSLLTLVALAARRRRK